MTPFSLDWTDVTVLHINKRTENRGNDIVHAKDIHWKMEGGNKLLDGIFPGLRNALYLRSGTVDAFNDDDTPELRTTAVDGKIPLKGECTGYQLTAKYGAVSSAQITLSGSEINQFKLDAKDGGSVTLFFRSQHTGLDGQLMGAIDMLDGKEVQVTLTPPTVEADKPTKTKTNDDQTQPFKFSVQPDGATVDNNPLKDATEMFIEAQVEAGKKPEESKKPAAKKTSKKK